MVTTTLRADREIRTDEVMYVHKDTVAYNIVYYGRTDAFDADDADPVWQIKRVSSVAGIQTTEYAQVGKYLCKWSDRYSYFSPDPAPETDPGLTVNANFTGLHIAGKVTIVTLNAATWTALPAAALANRNAICVINTSGVEIKLNYNSGIAGYVGVPLDALNQRFYDITDAIPIYAKTSAGTHDITVEELS